MYFSLHKSADSNCSLSRPPSWRYRSFEIPQLQALQTRLMQKVWHICFGNPVQNWHLFPSQHIHNSCGQNGRCRQSTTKSILAWTRSEYFPAAQTHHNIIVVLHISFRNLAAIKPENGPNSCPRLMPRAFTNVGLWIGEIVICQTQPTYLAEKCVISSNNLRKIRGIEKWWKLQLRQNKENLWI